MPDMAKTKPHLGDQIPGLVESLLAELGEDPDRQGLKATPARVSRALRQLTEEGLVERFEAFVGGIEIANAFTELNDPDEQRR